MRWLLGILALPALLTGCSRSRFREACTSAQPGERTSALGERLERRGGRYLGKVGPEHQWFQPFGFFRTQTCAVTDDLPPNPVAPDPRVPVPNESRVVHVRYVEGHDLL